MAVLSYNPVKKIHYNLNGVISRFHSVDPQVELNNGQILPVVRVDKITFSQNQTSGVIAITDGLNTIISKQKINQFLFQYGFVDFKHFYRHILCYYSSNHQQQGVELYILKFYDYADIIKNEE